MAHLSQGVDAEAEATLSAAALSLARGDAPGAARLLGQRLRHLEDHRWHLASALDLLVDAQVAAGQLEAARGAAGRLSATAGAASSPHLDALASRARGRVLVA